MYGLCDVWLWKHPGERQYTCQSSTYTRLARIDLVYMSNSLTSHTLDVSVLPSGISDHALVLLKLRTDLVPGPCLWRLSRFWVSDERITPLMATELGDFWVHNQATAAPAVVWDAFKAYAQGQYQLTIGKVRRESSLALEEVEAKAWELEAKYVISKTQDTYRDLQVLYKEKAVICTTSSQKILLNQSQRVFEQGERTGRLLAWLAKERSTTTHIAHIRDDDGLLHSDPTQIYVQFMRFY